MVPVGEQISCIKRMPLRVHIGSWQILSGQRLLILAACSAGSGGAARGEEGRVGTSDTGPGQVQDRVCGASALPVK